MEKRITGNFQKCLRFVTRLSVEPMAFFIFVAFHLWFTCFQTGLYQVICYRLYHTNTSIDCTKEIKDKSMQIQIQQSLSTWFMILMLSAVIPGMISLCVLGAWADLAGRKTNLVLSLSGFVIAAFPLTIIFTYKLTPLWILAIAHFICGSMGFLALIFISAMAYLSDTILDEKEMTIRMVTFNVFASVASVVGSFVSGQLLGNEVKLAKIIVIVEALFVMSIIYVLVRLEQLPPTEMRKKVFLNEHKDNQMKMNEIKAQEVNKPQNPKDSKSCRTVLSVTWTLLKDLVRTYTKKRPGNQQTFLIVSALILFLHMMADIGVKGNIMGQYVFSHPFNWTDGSKLGYWRAATAILHLFGNLVGIIIFKKVLKFHDTTIMLIAIFSGVGELIIIGVSTTDWMLYLAVVVGSLSNLFMPVVASFTASIVSNDEVGKSFVSHGLATSLAFMLSTAIFQPMYKATLKFYPGFVFLFGGALMVVCFFVILWIHILFIRQHKVADVNCPKLQEIGVIETHKSS